MREVTSTVTLPQHLNLTLTGGHLGSVVRVRLLLLRGVLSFYVENASPVCAPKSLLIGGLVITLMSVLLCMRWSLLLTTSLW